MGEKILAFNNLEISTPWNTLFTSDGDVNNLEEDILPEYIQKCRWFGGKARSMKQVKVDFHLPIEYFDKTAYLFILEVEYQQGDTEYYFLPVTFILDSYKEPIDETPITTICRIKTSDEQGKLVDASYDAHFRKFIFKSMADNKVKDYEGGSLTFQKGSKANLSSDYNQIFSHVLKADQSNTAIIYNNEYFFKFYRKVEKEINSDLEIVRFLSEKTSFKNSPTYAGSIEYKAGGKSIVIGLLQEMVQNQGEAWTMTMDSLDDYYQKVASYKKPSSGDITEKAAIFPDDAPEEIKDLIGAEFYELVMKLGERTAEMHLALASDNEEDAFRPEGYTMDYQQRLFEKMSKLSNDRLALLEQKIGNIPSYAKPLANEILSRRKDIDDCLGMITDHSLDAIRTRIHGDYHLGQVLFTGDDFIIIDYEGEPGFSFSERRLKKSPFKDVAGMIRSFHYAAYGKLMLNEKYKDHQEELEPWAEQWFQYISKFYLAAYLDKMGLKLDLSRDNKTLLEVYILEKAVYELGYELNSRPDWVAIPLRGIKFLIDQCIKNK